MDADFCVTALEEAIARFGKPEIFNTDQGSQFTSFAFTNTLRDAVGAAALASVAYEEPDERGNLRVPTLPTE
jgi:transposase InsO family protein